MKKKLLAIFLLLMLCMSIVPAGAVQPRYSYVHAMTAGIDRSGSIVTCFGSGHTLCDDTYTYVTVTLLRRAQDGGTWNYVASWSTSTSGMNNAAIERSVSVESGYDYQAYVNVQVKDANGTVLESVGMYSDINSYHKSTTTN